ncbi:MAG: hypothetical protein CHACPFDD_02935 [Phycisphaerae bacterium]|nr:hypothetical protein [Phycisphaerae bacterium]
MWNNIVSFVKTHLISLLCGVAALVFVGATLWGMSLDSVKNRMQERVSAAGEIKRFESSAINDAKIDAEKRRGELFQKEFEATLEVAHSINKREPLVPGLFPTAQNQAVKFEFVNKYKGSLEQMRADLMADGPPTAADIAEEEQNIIDLAQQEAESKTEDTPNPSMKPGLQQPQTPTIPGRPIGGEEFAGGRRYPPSPEEYYGAEGGEFAGRRPGRGGGEFGPGRGAMMAGMNVPSVNVTIPADQQKYNKEYRAAVNKAKSIRCYADVRSWHVSPIVESQLAPSPEDLWKAQVGLWLQQDVAKAVAEVNNEAAAAVQDGDPYVEHSPVKRIVSARIFGYTGAEKPLLFPMASGATGSSDVAGPAKSFTDRKSDAQFDVLRFTVTMVVDQREVTRVIDRVCRQNFYKCVGVRYAPLSPEDAKVGFMYGTAPVTQVTLDFEGYMSRAVFATLMPEEVRKALGITLEGSGG